MSALAKPKKSSRKPESAAETLDQLESMGDRVGNWIAENAVWLLGGAVALLVAAGGYGFASSRQDDARQAASVALAKVEGAFLREMGGSLDSISIEEPANPETARQVREKYVSLYNNVASEYSGSLESRIAAVEAGSLLQALGRSDEAIATWQAAIDASSSDGAVRGLLYQRLAGGHETEGRWAEAGAAYEAASVIAEFPVRYLALAEAIRCYADAGDSTKALALFDRLQSEAPQQQIAPSTQARMRELRATL